MPLSDAAWVEQEWLTRVDLILKPTTSGTVSVIKRNVLYNTPGLTAPGSFNTCPMCDTI